MNRVTWIDPISIEVIGVLKLGISKLLVYEHVLVCLTKYLKREWTVIDLIDIRKKK
jgi:hypothetical protein